jgi:hypothetical protein
MDSTDLAIAIFITVTLLIVISVVYFQNKTRKERLIHQAEKRGGEIHKGGLFRLIELWIPFKDTVIVIRTIPGSKYSPPKTVAQVNLTSPRLTTTRILHNDLWQKALTTLGKERLPTGDEEFDSRWVVQADDAFIVQKLITAEFKAKLAEPILHSLDIRIQPQQASFTITVIPSDDEGYDHFINTVILVLQKIL